MNNYILTYEDVFFVFLTACLFFQGFYFGRRQMWRLLIMSLAMILSSIISIVLHGLYSLDVTIYKIMIGVIHGAFWWGVGYVMSHVIVVKETDIAKVERMYIGNK